MACQKSYSKKSYSIEDYKNKLTDNARKIGYSEERANEIYENFLSSYSGVFAKEKLHSGSDTHGIKAAVQLCK